MYNGRVDILLAVNHGEGAYLSWLEQPSSFKKQWKSHKIGDIQPDILTGLCTADINNDGNQDIMVGSYSRGNRSKDGDVGVNDKLGRLAWFEQKSDADTWIRHDISRRKRGMFDKISALDLDKDGDMDFISTRGNSEPYDGVFWLEQVRTERPSKSFTRARQHDSQEMALPNLKTK